MKDLVLYHDNCPDGFTAASDIFTQDVEDIPANVWFVVWI